jgi:orotate phosphoribosyltransferase
VTVVSNKELIDELIGLKAVEFGDFVLASGKRSDYYVNIKRATTQTSFLKIVSKHMAPHALGHEKIAGVALGAVPLVVALALELDLPFAIVRKERKEHGTKAAVEGSVKKGEKILFVEDVTTTANTLKNAIMTVRDMGGVVDKALCVVDRQEGASENLKGIDVELISLVTADELLRNR